VRIRLPPARVDLLHNRVDLLHNRGIPHLGGGRQHTLTGGKRMSSFRAMYGGRLGGGSGGRAAGGERPAGHSRPGRCGGSGPRTTPRHHPPRATTHPAPPPAPPEQPTRPHADTLPPRTALVAQWIEHAPPKRGMQVRFLPGASPLEAAPDGSRQLPDRGPKSRLCRALEVRKCSWPPCYRPPFFVAESTLEAPTIRQAATADLVFPRELSPWALPRHTRPALVARCAGLHATYTARGALIRR
jgi:hypothetical protein